MGRLCEILITHQNREISRNVESTTVILLNYMTVTTVLWAGRKLNALEMGADKSPNSIACKSTGGLRLATIAERVKKCAIEDAGPLILQYWQNCSLCSIGILQKAIKVAEFCVLC